MIQLALLIAMITPPAADDHGSCQHLDKKTIKLTTEVTIKFYEAFEKRDLDGLLANIETPWYHDGRAVLHSKVEVREEFKALFEQRRDLGNRKVADAKSVHCYHTVRDRISPSDRRILDQVAKENDYVVLVILRDEQNPKQMKNVTVIVRVTDGTAKVVGVKN